MKIIHFGAAIAATTLLSLLAACGGDAPGTSTGGSGGSGGGTATTSSSTAITSTSTTSTSTTTTSITGAGPGWGAHGIGTISAVINGQPYSATNPVFSVDTGHHVVFYAGVPPVDLQVSVWDATATGTTHCESKPEHAEIFYGNSTGVAFGTFGTCTVTLTQAAAGPGGRWVGTFSAEMPTADYTSTVTITDGVIDVTMP